MRILVYRWDIYPYEDIIETFRKQGHFVDVPAFSEINHLRDEEFENRLSDHLRKESYDFVFSVNYFSVIARVCHNFGIRYVSWSVDTPLISMRTNTICYPENRIFTFDQKEYLEFRQRGVEQIYHLPLAGNPDRLNHAMIKTAMNTQSEKEPGVSESPSSPEHFPISFVGNLYDKNRYDEMAHLLPDYLRGYLDAILQAQLHVSGGCLFPTLISDSMFQEIKPWLRMEPGYEDCFTGPFSQEEVLKLQFNTRVLCHKSASLNRIRLLNALAQRYPVHLFTTSDPTPLSQQVITHPPVDYHREMSRVFYASKINLNITSPNIESGIPLRVWDILSAGGFLLTDYSPEYEGLLEDGHDLVLFDDLEDLLQKADYYLTHEEERCHIAANGQETVRQRHHYNDRIKKMLCMI